MLHLVLYIALHFCPSFPLLCSLPQPLLAPSSAFSLATSPVFCLFLSLPSRIILSLHPNPHTLFLSPPHLFSLSPAPTRVRVVVRVRERERGERESERERERGERAREGERKREREVPTQTQTLDNISIRRSSPHPYSIFFHTAPAAACGGSLEEHFCQPQRASPAVCYTVPLFWQLCRDLQYKNCFCMSWYDAYVLLFQGIVKFFIEIGQ